MDMFLQPIAHVLKVSIRNMEVGFPSCFCYILFCIKTNVFIIYQLLFKLNLTVSAISLNVVFVNTFMHQVRSTAMYAYATTLLRM